MAAWCRNSCSSGCLCLPVEATVMAQGGSAVVEFACDGTTAVSYNWMVFIVPAEPYIKI